MIFSNSFIDVDAFESGPMFLEMMYDALSPFFFRLTSFNLKFPVDVTIVPRYFPLGTVRVATLSQRCIFVAMCTYILNSRSTLIQR